MNIGIIIVLAIGAIWALGMFFGVIGGLSKTFNHPQTSAIDSSSTKEQEEQSIEDTKEKQQKLMDDMKQKMEDQNQKF